MVVAAVMVHFCCIHGGGYKLKVTEANLHISTPRLTLQKVLDGMIVKAMSTGLSIK